MLAVAMATRLNNFRSSRFKTTILPADSLSLSLCFLSASLALHSSSKLSVHTEALAHQGRF